MALGQYPSVPPKRLQQILTASHYGGIGSGTNRNLLQFQQQQQADSLDGNNNAIVDFSTTNALQLPPILFASSSSLMPHNTSETTTTTSTVAIPPNPTTTMGRGRPSKQSISLHNSNNSNSNNNNNNTSTKHYYSYRLVIPTTKPSPSPQRQQRYLPLPVLSDPILFPKVISDIVRTYLTQKEECSNQKRVLIKLQRDLSYQQLQQPNPSTKNFTLPNKTFFTTIASIRMLVKSIKIHLIPQILILLLTLLHFRTKLIFLTYYLPPTTFVVVVCVVVIQDNTE